VRTTIPGTSVNSSFIEREKNHVGPKQFAVTIHLNRGKGAAHETIATVAAAATAGGGGAFISVVAVIIIVVSPALP